MGRHKVAVGIATAALLWTGFVVLPAKAGQTVSCTDEVKEFTVDPGLGREPSSGTVQTDGQTGTLDCGGRQGTIGFVAGYGTKDPDSCTQGGEGTAVFNWTLDGKKDSAYVTYEYGALKGGAIGVVLKGQRLNGDGQVTPTEGDCVTSPMTKGKAAGHLTLVLK